LLPPGGEAGFPEVVCPQHGPPDVSTFTVDVVTTEFAPVEAAVDVAPPGIGVALPVVRKFESPVIILGSVIVPLVKKDDNPTLAGGCLQFGGPP